MSTECEIKEIVKKVLSPRHETDDIELDTNLTSAPLEIAAEELVYIVLELMKKYNIRFESSDFEDYKFTSIRKMAEVVKKYIG